jgi:SWI/SNF-related matrix-associated actin-dependent regulator 1 of chromatin subfamily A
VGSVLQHERQLSVLGNEAILKTPFDPELVEAIRAIPGRRYDPTTKFWHVGLANDRASSVLALADYFTDVHVEPVDRATLQEIVDTRELTFDLELANPLKSGRLCISLCDWWRDADLHRFIDSFEHFEHPQAGRISVVLDQWSARAAAALHRMRDDVRWTRPLFERIEGFPAVEEGSDEAKDFASWLSALNPSSKGLVSVRFDGGKARLHIRTTRTNEVLEALPSSVSLAGVVYAPTNRATALGLSALVAAGHDVQLAPQVRDWAATAGAWSGSVAVTLVDRQPRFTIVAGRDQENHPKVLLAEPSELMQPGIWRIPFSTPGHDAMRTLLAGDSRLSVDPKVQLCLDLLADRDGGPIPGAIMTVEDEGDQGIAFKLRVIWDDSVISEFSTLPGTRRAAGMGPRDRPGETVVVADPWNAAIVADYVDVYNVELDDLAKELLDRLTAEHAEGEAIIARSSATAGTIELKVENGELMPFQIAGVEYALDRRRTFIADEQGLGKTVQALLTLEADNAYPAIVLCPASLKLNWQREVHRWLPNRSVQLLQGRGEQLVDAEIIVVNYEILEPHVERLVGVKSAALVLDESHYCKSPRAKRTQAAQSLSDTLPKNALKLALTGTPLVNRPKELVPQLRIIGRLSDFGSGAGFERSFDRPEERERLHWHLRRSCYLRRLKKDVLPQLPAKQRAVVPVTLANQKEYVRAEAAFVEWLKDKFTNPDELNHQLTMLTRAEALIKINALRQLAGIGKVPMATAWIEDFLASGEKLVVFAQHRAVQSAIVKAFPEAVHLLGSDSGPERDEAVQRFQNDPDVRLCVCSLKVAAHGFTLTAAANVAFVELGWTPAEHDQAEDRCHRIGQQDSVTAWYVLAAGTIDERIGALIEHKRRIVESVTDGRTDADTATLTAILEDYLTHEDAEEI